MKQFMLQHGYIDSNWETYNEYQSTERQTINTPKEAVTLYGDMISEKMANLSKASAGSVTVNPLEVVEIDTHTRSLTDNDGLIIGDVTIITSNYVPVYFVSLADIIAPPVPAPTIEQIIDTFDGATNKQIVQFALSELYDVLDRDSVDKFYRVLTNGDLLPDDAEIIPNGIVDSLLNRIISINIDKGG